MESVIAPLLIIGIFFLIGFAYSVVVPPFETPDEVYHYAFARHLALGNSLPVQTVEADGPWEHEGTQAPLYYFLLGKLITPIDHTDFEALTHINVRANLGNPLYPGNKNFMLYSTQVLPLRGTNLAVHLGRWFSLLLSTLTLWLTYKIGRLAFPAAPHLAGLVLLIPATIPQFAFISASVSNDALVILLSTATLYKLTSLISRPFDQPLSWQDWLVLGILLALAALSKLHALGLLPLTALVLVGLAWQRHEWRLLVRAIPIIGLIFVLLAGWWYWRNFALYGDFLAMGKLLEIEGLRTTSSSLQDFWGELRGLRYSFWGVFGWFSILLPTWIYRLLDLVTLLAFIGWLVAAGRIWRSQNFGSWLAHPPHLVWLCLATWGILLIGLMLTWLTFAISSQGRLLFPGLSAYSVMLVLGLNSLFHFGRRAISRLAHYPRQQPEYSDPPGNHLVLSLYALPVGLLAASLYALLVLLPQSYYATPPVAEIPARAQKVGRVYGERIEVVAMEVAPGPHAPGARIPVTLYLRKLRETGSDYQLFLQLLDHELKEIANVTTHPGWGKNPTTLWEVDQIYADTYELAVAQEIAGELPIQARLYLGFMNHHGELLEVPGYEWDIASRTIGYVLIH